MSDIQPIINGLVARLNLALHIRVQVVNVLKKGQPLKVINLKHHNNVRRLRSNQQN